MSDVDDYADLHRQFKAIEKRLDIMKLQLLDLPNGLHQGERWELWIIPKTQDRLDTVKLKKECSTIYAEYTKEIPYREITVNRRI